MKRRRTVMEKLISLGFAPQDLGLLPEEFKGKFLILKPTAVKARYRSKEDLVWKIVGGFGCSPGRRSSAVCATCQGDGETAYWMRRHFVAEYVGKPIERTR